MDLGGVGGPPEVAVAAVAKFVIFGELPSVGIKGIAV